METAKTVVALLCVGAFAVAFVTFVIVLPLQSSDNNSNKAYNTAIGAGVVFVVTLIVEVILQAVS